MKTVWWRTLLAMIIGLGASAATLTIITAVIAIESGELDVFWNNWIFQILGSSIMVSAFALVGWLISVLPMTIWASTRKWLAHPVALEGIWAVLAVLSFAMIIIPLAGLQAMIAAWIPALIGLFCGHAYRHLLRRMEHRT